MANPKKVRTDSYRYGWFVGIAGMGLWANKASRLAFWAAFFVYFAFGELANGVIRFPKKMIGHLLGSFP
jgi:hypothetical protein